MADPHHVADAVSRVADAAPFLIGAAQAQPKLSGTRILEMVIGAAVIGSLTVGYNTIVVIPQIRLEQQYERQAAQRDINYIRESMTELKEQVKDLRARVEFLNATRRN